MSKLPLVLLATVLVSLLTARSAPADSERSYVFILRGSKSAKLCTHMTATFNGYFRDMWDVPPFDPQGADYLLNSKYAFPLAEGVPHSAEAAFRFKYSKSPNPPEFAKVRWVQARAGFDNNKDGSHRPQDESVTASSQQIALKRLLIAHGDIDNDGAIDTLIKWDAIPSYSYVASGSSQPYAEEISVIRGVAFEWPDQMTISEFYKRFGTRVFTISGTMVRPFVFANRTYIAKYSIDLGPQNRLVRNKPYEPRERMTILEEYSTTVASESETVYVKEKSLCEFTMQQMKLAR